MLYCLGRCLSARRHMLSPLQDVIVQRAKVLTRRSTAGIKVPLPEAVVGLSGLAAGPDSERGPTVAWRRIRELSGSSDLIGQDEGRGMRQ